MKMENTNKIIWKTTDYKSRSVVLRSKEKEHILEGHGIMGRKENMSAIKNTVESPDSVYVSAEISSREVLFSGSAGASYEPRNLQTKVIVEYDSVSSGHVVTAFPIKKVGGNIGEKLYPEDDV